MTGSGLDLRVQLPEQSVPEMVVRQVRQAILDGTLTPGRRLTEPELIALTGVSRTSIREALRTLQNLGLVESADKRGLRVAVLTSVEVQHIYEVRDALEPAAAELFCRRATDAEVTELIRHVAPPEAETEERLRLIYRFDELLLEGARNPLLKDILSPLHARIHALRRLSTSIPGRQAASTREYVELSRAIQDRSPERAAAAAHVHIRAAAQAALEAVLKLESEQSAGRPAAPLPPTARAAD